MFLVRRAQDLRLAAASMTQAAMRLTEPESAAAHKIATVGQAVRREVREDDERGRRRRDRRRFVSIARGLMNHECIE